MKKIAKMLLSTFIWSWSKIYSYKVSCKKREIYKFFYTKWLTYCGLKIGKNSSVDYRCTLLGSWQESLTIGENTHIRSNVIIGCWDTYYSHGGLQKFSPIVKIGSRCSIGEYNHITSINQIIIGDGLLTGRYVYIGDNAHGGLSLEEGNIPPAKRELKSKGEIIIGDNVWIGDKVTILGGVTIGRNVIVGANSVVTRSIPSNTVVGGIPAQIIKRLS